MTVVALSKKIVSLKIEDSLYSFLETQADVNKEGLNDLIQRLLSESMESWCDYCDTMHSLSNEEERSIHVCIKD